MKSIFKFSILLLILFSACNRKKVEFLGPAFIAAPDGFAVTSFTASATDVDFTAGPVYYNATFTNSVTWTLTIVGQKSKAVYELKGISNGFTNLEWKGTHTSIEFFRKGETTVATLSFFGNKLTSSVNVDVVKPRNFAIYGQFPLEGDFENPKLVEPQPTPPFYSPYWASFNYPTAIPNVEQGVDSMAIDYNNNLVPSVEGTKYYYIKGKGNQQVFVSGLQYFGALLPKLPEDPTQVWVNMYIYGTGDPNAGVELEYQETDDDGFPGYQGADDDAFTAKFSLAHKGWKLFSFRYSDLIPSLNADFGGSGNKKHEPHNLVSFDLVAVKKLYPDKPLEIYFDYPIITVGGPFNPSK